MKSLPLAPVMATLVSVSVPLPLFVSVTVCGVEVLPTLIAANVKLPGESETKGDAVPVPLRVTVWVPGEALSLNVSAPVAEPEAVGEKVMLKVQEPPALSEAPQVLVCPNGPVMPMLLIVRVEPPLLDRVAT